MMERSNSVGLQLLLSGEREIPARGSRICVYSGEYTKDFVDDKH